MFLCSCATPPHPSAIIPATDLPAEVSINKDAGRGGMLMVTLRLEDGENLPFMVDTGSTGTLLDKSLKSKLGKRLGTGTAVGWGGKGKTEAYAAPRLYLGNTPLLTGDKVWIADYKHPSGMLGMDCLKHYCIQLDFAAGKMRFLRPDHVNAAELGKAFPLTMMGNLPYVHHPGLLGKSGTNLLIDIGCRIDGLEEKSAIKGLAQILPDCVWDGETYTNLAVAAVEHANVLGLGFFARHLVTFDFPRRTMYLKPTSVGPLADDSAMETGNDEIGAPAEFLETLKDEGRLPGLSKDDQGALCLEAYSNFGSPSANVKGVAYVRAYFNSSHQAVTFAFWKNDGSPAGHYQVVRAAKDRPWELQRAWQTDVKGLVVQEYAIP
jgi:hypothetical protein